MTFSEKKNSTWKKSETVLFTCSLSCGRSVARLYGEEWRTTYIRNGCVGD